MLVLFRIWVLLSFCLGAWASSLPTHDEKRFLWTPRIVWCVAMEKKLISPELESVFREKVANVFRAISSEERVVFMGLIKLLFQDRSAARRMRRDAYA